MDMGGEELGVSQLLFCVVVETEGLARKSAFAVHALESRDNPESFCAMCA